MKKPLNEEFKRMQKLAGLINETMYVDDKGELIDDGLLSREEWDKYYKEYEKNYKFNWLTRQLDILDGEEEKTKYAWNFSIAQIEEEFKTNSEAASIIFDIFQILKTTITHWTSLPDPEYAKYKFEIDDMLKNMSDEEAIEFIKHPDQRAKSKLLRSLTNDLFKWATPKELVDNMDNHAWENMASTDDYDDYIDWNG
jgi:hypothetical protein